MRSPLLRTMAGVALAVAVLAVPTRVRGWGMEVHKLLTKRAIDNLPQEIRPFFAAQREYIGEHSADPDLWRVVDLRGALGAEDPNHFLDIDGLGEPSPFTGVPREWEAFVAKYGLDRANRAGRLPWRTEEIYKKLVTTFKDVGRGTPAYAPDNARYLVAVLAHYLGDGHQPFHAVENYDGQLTGQRGIHSRFETDLVLRNLSTLTWTPAVVKPIPDIKAFMFATITESASLVPGLLDADRAATQGRDFYDDAYFAAFLKAARPTLEKRLNDSVSSIVSVIVAAWNEAGRPELPLDRPRTPGRIIRH